MTTIKDCVFGSLNAFQSLTEAFSQEGLDHATESNPWPKEDCIGRIKNAQSRFKVWSGNIGAHRSGRSSLEYRLRDASNLRRHVVGLLEDLIRSLQDAKSIVQGGTTPWMHQDLENSDSESSEDDEADPVSHTGYPFDSELSQVLADVAEIVNCLLRLSITIKNPSSHDRFTKSHSTDSSHYEPFDIQHVRMKFPLASNEITERLGKALSQRRQYFKYRESHHQKLSWGLDDDEADGKSTVASSLPQHLKSSVTEAAQILDEDRESVSGFSQTSFATSAATSDRKRVPDLPKEACEGPFPCKFCHMVISIGSRRSWKKHVYGDLRPYACLWEHCDNAHKEYQRRHHWIEHVLQDHWRVWTCAFGCVQDFDSAKDIKAHFKSQHPGASSPENIETTLLLCERPRSLGLEIACPLCKGQLCSIKEYQRHVGRHLEDTFLFALPSVPEYEDVEGSEEEPGHHSQGKGSSSDDSVLIKPRSDTTYEAEAIHGEPNQSTNSEVPSNSPTNMVFYQVEENAISSTPPLLKVDAEESHQESLETDNNLYSLPEAAQEKIKLQKQIEFLKAEQDELEKQKELESQIRKNAKEAIERRIEELRLSQAIAEAKVKVAKVESEVADAKFRHNEEMRARAEAAARAKLAAEKKAVESLLLQRGQKGLERKIQGLDPE